MEALLRLAVFLSILSAMMVWELFSPRRQSSLTRRQRWPVNLGLAASNAALMRAGMGASAWLAAQWAAEHQIGLFNLLVLPAWLGVALSLLLLDLAIYAQHIAAHRWRWFWRLHQVHHADVEFDTTTAVRFHPLEIMLSMLYKVLLVLLLGVEPKTVIAFEMILNGCALFNHGNVYLPEGLERRLRYLLVTPDMHRIHHSVYQPETDSNYGFSLSWWDRLFKTYCPRPNKPQTEMTIGLSGMRDAAELGFVRMLTLPFTELRRR
ncbi:MAG: sterol desaturase family protein [Methylomonas sp.]|nr:sterol desaturase family protein [Methylomonas sp.]